MVVKCELCGKPLRFDEQSEPYPDLCNRCTRDKLTNGRPFLSFKITEEDTGPGPYNCGYPMQDSEYLSDPDAVKKSIESHHPRKSSSRSESGTDLSFQRRNAVKDKSRGASGTQKSERSSTDTGRRHRDKSDEAPQSTHRHVYSETPSKQKKKGWFRRRL